jgi:peptide deformylase
MEDVQVILPPLSPPANQIPNQKVLKISVGPETNLTLDNELKPLKLVQAYDPILRQKLDPYKFNATDIIQTEQYIQQMIATLIDHKGYGISANQVGLPFRLCVIGGADSMGYEPMFNPSIIDHGKDEEVREEGCLSFPYLFLNIKRYTWVRVAWQNIRAEQMEHMFTGLTARIIQHELDHLDGITICQKVSPFELRRGKERAMTLSKKHMRALRDRDSPKN